MSTSKKKSLTMRENNQRTITLQQFYDDLIKQNDHFMNAVGDLYGTDNETTGLIDSTVSPHNIYDMVHKDTYFGGLLDMLMDALFKDGYKILNKDNKEDNLTRRINEKLKQIDYELLVYKILYGLVADGGGNVLLFTTKENGQVKLNAEPFWTEGNYRVRVYSNKEKRKITKYEVGLFSLGSGLSEVDPRIVYTLYPDKNYVKQLRYNLGGDFRLSSNPAKRAVYWYILKNYIAGANQSAFENGLQDGVIMTPDYSILNSLSNAISNDKIQATPEMMRDPIRYLANQSKLDTELLKTILGNPRNTNKLIKTHLGYKFQTVGSSNREMQSIEMIDFCDQQMGYSLLTSKGILNTKDSKYSNAEVEKDNWISGIVDNLKKYIEKITNDHILEIYAPLVVEKGYRVYWGRDLSQEDLDIFQLKTQRNSAIADILTKVNTLEGYEYDLEKHEIVKVGEVKGDASKNNEDEVEGVKEEADDDTRAQKKNNSIKDIKDTKEFRNFRKMLSNVNRRILQDFKRIVKNTKTDKGLLNSYKKIKTLNHYGLNINVLKTHLNKFTKFGFDIAQEQIIKEKKVEGSRGKRSTFSDIDTFADAYAQVILRGWDTITEEHLRVFKLVFTDTNIENFKIVTSEDLDFGFWEELRDLLEDAFRQAKEEEAKLEAKKEKIQNSKKYTDAQKEKKIDKIEREIINRPPLQTLVIEKIDVYLNNIDFIDIKAIKLHNSLPRQLVEGAKFLRFREAGYKTKTWRTVLDDNVRPKHVRNKEEGTIPIDDEFDTGIKTPASEWNCRCTLKYGF